MLSNYACSLFDAIFKKQNEEIIDWHRIHDLSFSHDLSVNDEIPKHYRFLIYQTIDDVICIIEKLGHHMTLHKRNLKDIFRKIPVNSLDYFLLLFQWVDQIYIDIFLSFDCAISSFIFNMFVEALYWILNYIFHIYVVHYLDDFLLFNLIDKSLFSTIYEQIEFEEKSSKSLDDYIIDFTDIELDIDKLEARLLKNKHDKTIKAISNTFIINKTSHKSLKSLFDYLSFCTRVISLEYSFLRNLFNYLVILFINSHITCSFPKLAILDLY